MLFLSISRFHSDLVQEMQQKMKKYSQSPIWASNDWGAAIEKPQLSAGRILKQEFRNVLRALTEVRRPPPALQPCSRTPARPGRFKQQQSPLESDSR